MVWNTLDRSVRGTCVRLTGFTVGSGAFPLAGLRALTGALSGWFHNTFHDLIRRVISAIWRVFICSRQKCCMAYEKWFLLYYTSFHCINGLQKAWMKPFLTSADTLIMSEFTSAGSGPCAQTRENRGGTVAALQAGTKYCSHLLMFSYILRVAQTLWLRILPI